MKKVICIGSATKDMFLEIDEGRIIDNQNDLTAQKLISFEFGAKIYANSFRQELGGSAVNIATGLHACDYRAFVFSRSSKSEVGKWIQKQIGKRKLKKNYFQQTSGVESEVTVVISEKKHKDHVIFRTGDSVQQFDVKRALNKFREKVDWIYVGSQKKEWKGRMDEIIRFSKQKGAPIAINPSGYQIEKDAKKLLSVLRECQIVFMNKDEAIEVLMNAEGKTEDDIKYIFSRLQNYITNVLVITNGENGAYVSDDKKILHIPTQAVSVVDTVGAGDAFSSAFLASYANEKDVKKALTWGIMNSGAVLSKQGATNGLLKTRQLRRGGSRLVKKISQID